MTNDDGRRRTPSSHPFPAVGETGEMAWDDDRVPREDEDRSSERVTAIPELPSEVFAKRLMAEALEDPVSGTFETGDESAALKPRIPTTLPPPARRRPPLAEPSLEIDEAALDSAVAARGRWHRSHDPSEQPPQSLELDLSALETAPSPPGAPTQPAPPEPLAPAPPSGEPALRELNDRYAMGDYSGALVVAEGILEGDPGHAEALRFAKSCREVLTGMYTARLGALDQVVSVDVPGDQIRWLSLDHRAGFLLSVVDGTLTLEEILDISGMPRLDALRIMFSLLSEGVIRLGPRG